MPDPKRPGKGGLLGRLLGGRGDARKGMPLPKKKVWRISERSPRGEWVDADSISSVPPPVAPTQPAELSASGWLTSSMDLLGGAEIVEVPDDTAPTPLDEADPRTLPLPRKQN